METDGDVTHTIGDVGTHDIIVSSRLDKLNSPFVVSAWDELMALKKTS